MVKKKKKRTQKKISKKEYQAFLDKINNTENRSIAESNAGAGIGIGFVIFIIWIIFKVIAKSS